MSGEWVTGGLIGAGIAAASLIGSVSYYLGTRALKSGLDVIGEKLNMSLQAIQKNNRHIEELYGEVKEIRNNFVRRDDCSDWRDTKQDKRKG